MIRITYVEASGEEHVVEARPGVSVMEAAVLNDVPGIVGECGGYCACGTCRVYVDQAAWREKTGSRSELEQAMVDFHEDADPHVRLGCQIQVTPQLDGLVLRMPGAQHSGN